MNNNNTIVTGITIDMFESGNVPHPADHPNLFEMSGDKYVYVGSDNFVETVKAIQVTNNKIYASDPCYLDTEKLRVEVDKVRNGVWTVDYSGPNLRAINRDYKLTRFHAGEDVFIEWDDAIGIVYVDTGLAGFSVDANADVFDKESNEFDYRFTLRGDGGFPVLVKYHDGEVVALEIVYTESCIFNYYHEIVPREDQDAAIAAVEEGDWNAYNELAEHYNTLSGEYPCFPPIIFIGNGSLPLTEETFGLVEHCGWENG